MKIMKLADRLWIAWHVIRSHAVSVTTTWDESRGRRTAIEFDENFTFDRMPLQRKARRG